MITKPLKVGDVFKHEKESAPYKVIEIREVNGQKYLVVDKGSEIKSSMSEDFYLNKHCFVLLKEPK